MDPDHPLRLTIEVEHANPLAGRIGDAQRGMTPFSGWIGLGSELDRLLTEEAGETPEVQIRPSGRMPNGHGGGRRA